MELSNLARKQKRLQYWNSFLESQVSCEDLRLRFVDTTKLYRNGLSKCWEIGEIGPEELQNLENLERQLEELTEEARLTVIGEKDTEKKRK